jgi:8-oxo-dGTP pyrophosphatase MutT (NUDIX family)
MIAGDDRMRRRRSAKVILLDEEDHILLFRGGDPSRPSDGTWWFPPGGGVEPDETDDAAARRELWEETGLRLDDVGPVVATREAKVEFDGASFVSDEVYFVVRVRRFRLDTSGWTDLERQVVVEHRWWSMQELDGTDETVYPERLLEIVGGIVERPSG